VLGPPDDPDLLGQMDPPSSEHYFVDPKADAAPYLPFDARWQVMPAWTRASILNVARMAWFSSDRTIAEYAQEIWRSTPVPG